jgi:hypothetical protein
MFISMRVLEVVNKEEMIMKIEYTKQMKEALVGETIYKIDVKSLKSGLKGSWKDLEQVGWKKYRIVKVMEGLAVEYKVQETILQPSFSLVPRCLGGYFGNYERLVWGDMGNSHDSYESAFDVVEERLTWKYFHRDGSEDIIGWFPE